MDRQEWGQQLAEEVETALTANCAVSEYLVAVREALAVKGGVLSRAPRLRWGGLVLRCCESASFGDWDLALPAAAALEIMAAALELLDDLEDGDSLQIGARRERALATNVACGLIVSSQLSMFRLDRNKQSAERAPKALRRLLAAAARIGGGQHLDLVSEGRCDISQDVCLTIASQKSAELVKCACEIGAMLGADDEDLIALYGQFGWHLGMFAQIVNDIEGVRSPDLAKSDVSLLKATLPIAFWLRGQTHGDANARWLDLASRPDCRRISEEICASGALHFAWVAADLHRQHALETLRELDSFRPASSILGCLVELVEPEPILFSETD